GPKTTAPDSAPSAASPPRRSSATATEEINDRAKAANAIILFMQVPLVSRGRSTRKMRREEYNSGQIARPAPLSRHPDLDVGGIICRCLASKAKGDINDFGFDRGFDYCRHRGDLFLGDR